MVGVKPQDFWGNPDNAQWWIDCDERYARDGFNQESEDWLKDHMPQDAKVLLEVGAGTGRLIRLFKRKRHTVDINPALCELVKAKYPAVIVHNRPAHDIDLPRDSVDLVYTFQALQHIPNDLIHQTLTELLRVTNDRLLLMEGWMPNKEQGEMTHRANGGSFCYYYDKIFKCEWTEWVEPEKIKAYMIRKADNPIVPDIEFGQFV